MPASRLAHNFSQIPILAPGESAGNPRVLQQKVVSPESVQGWNRQHRKNNTGLPDNLKAGVESLSGMSLDKVKVHYKSAKPEQFNALAYAQGNDIHVAPGQEQHPPHEVWHLVQQAQGRVKPTMQMKGVPVNDDAGLEREADVMGAKALRGPLEWKGPQGNIAPVAAGPIQRYKQVGTDRYELRGESDTDHFFKTQSVDPELTKKKGQEYKIAHKITRTDEKQGLLVSEDNTLAINDTQEQAKEFYAAPGIAERSNKALEAAKSKVRLDKSGELKLRHAGVSLSKITAKPDQKVEHESAAEFAGLVSHICIEMASGVMGSSSHEAVFQRPDSQKKTVLNIRSTPDEGDPMIDTLGSELVSSPEKVDAGNIRTNMLNKPRPELPGEAYGKHARTRKGRQKARRLGVNEGARPEVGEGYATFSVAAAKDKQIDFLKTGESREVLKNIWGYHYAGVVARSNDRTETVTLENYNRTDDVYELLAEIIKRQVNSNAAKFQGVLKDVTLTEKATRQEIQEKLLLVLKRARGTSEEEAQTAFLKILQTYNSGSSWFFRMQGSRKGQSFHEQQAESDAFVNPLTMRVRPQDEKREGLRNAGLQWMQNIPKAPGTIAKLPAFQGWTDEIETNSNAIQHAETASQIKKASKPAKDNVITAGIRRSLAAMIGECAATGSPALAKAMDNFAGAGSIDEKAAFVKTEASKAYSSIEDRIQELSIFSTEKHMSYAMAQARAMDAMRYSEALAAHYRK